MVSFDAFLSSNSIVMNARMKSDTVFGKFGLELSLYPIVQDMSDNQQTEIETNLGLPRLYACHETFWTCRRITISIPLHAIHEVTLLATCYCVWVITRASKCVSPHIWAYNLLLTGPTRHLLFEFLRSTGYSSGTPYAPCTFLRRSLNHASHTPGFHYFG
jgi:hypothetical protein